MNNVPIVVLLGLAIVGGLHGCDDADYSRNRVVANNDSHAPPDPQHPVDPDPGPCGEGGCEPTPEPVPEPEPELPCVTACAENGDCFQGEVCWLTIVCPFDADECCENMECSQVVPDSDGTCATDADCEPGVAVCDAGQCQPCQEEEVLLYCELSCPHGYETRNGCSICACREECYGDAHCPANYTCVPGPNCDMEDGCPELYCCSGNWCRPPSFVACEGPNPMCDDSSGDHCVPSSCRCDTTVGSWVCLENCDGSAECDSLGCAGTTPAGCVTDSDCQGSRERCLPNPTSTCLSSFCGCADNLHGWICLDDCLGGVCGNPQDFCHGAGMLGCSDNLDCPSSQFCGEAVSGTPGCHSTCDCDPLTGIFSCDDECAELVCQFAE